ncbi:MAG: dephospho-CoA kinase [bacterium]|jgi:dephospho-CoA kinase|nr:dephospho-CoA kinase [candidate division KSB1 bacterium]MDH7560607.1 dephospho-CoA kinase [bacterium]
MASKQGTGIVVGLTGGIGSGKSAVARLLSRYGLPVIHADAIGHEVTSSDPAVQAALRAAFGEQIFAPDGKLRREELAAIVFAHPQARQKLNAIVHPPMRQRIDAQVAAHLATGAPIVVVDAALLGEADLVSHMDYLVVVYAPLEERVERIRRRNGLSEEQVRARMAAQMPLEEKVRLADYVVENSGSLFALRAQVRALFSWLQARLQESGRAV